MDINLQNKSNLDNEKEDQENEADGENDKNDELQKDDEISFSNNKELPDEQEMSQILLNLRHETKEHSRDAKQTNLQSSASDKSQ